MTELEGQLAEDLNRLSAQFGTKQRQRTGERRQDYETRLHDVHLPAGGVQRPQVGCPEVLDRGPRTIATRAAS